MSAEIIRLPIIDQPRWSVSMNDIAALQKFCCLSPRGYQWEAVRGDTPEETYIKLQSTHNELAILLILADTKRMQGWVGMDRDGVVFSTGDTVCEVIGRLGFTQTVNCGERA